MSTTETTTPAFDPATFDPTKFDPFSIDFLADPFPVYAWFREHQPVWKVSLAPDFAHTAYWIFRDADARTVLNHPDVYGKLQAVPTATSVGPFEVAASLPTGIMNSNVDRHQTLRDWVDPIFTHGIAAAQATAEGVTQTIMATIANTRRFELMTSVALPIPSGVLYTLLGFTASEQSAPVLVNWTSALLAAHNAQSSMTTKMMGGTVSLALLAYLEGLIDLRVRSGLDVAGMVGDAAASVQRGDMSAANAAAVFHDITVAGYITTTFLIGNGIKRLLEFGDQRTALRADPSLMPSAIEEMMRYDAPAQMVSRQTSEDVELSGTKIAAGSRVNVVLGSANRDGSTYHDPERFDIRRFVDTSTAPQLAFGGGIHHCIGAPLARITTPTAIAALLELDDLRANGTVQWQSDPFLRGPTSEPLAYGP